jgi:tRNA (Thr-GGU) A37 N-methylase
MEVMRPSVRPRSQPERRRPRSATWRIVEVVSPTRLLVDALEAIDGTPIVDVKPVLDPGRER